LSPRAIHFLLQPINRRYVNSVKTELSRIDWLVERVGIEPTCATIEYRSRTGHRLWISSLASPTSRTVCVTVHTDAPFQSPIICSIADSTVRNRKSSDCNVTLVSLCSATSSIIPLKTSENDVFLSVAICFIVSNCRSSKCTVVLFMTYILAYHCMSLCNRPSGCAVTPQPQHNRN
jgi:hypothetical protein